MTSTRKAARDQLWVLHWLMAALFVVLFAGGMVMTELPREVSFRGDLYGFHKSLGVLVMFLLTARILVMLRAIVPAKPKNWLATAALHTSLYVLMVLVPLSGYFYSNTAGRDVALFGLPLPTLFSENRELRDTAGEMHGWLAYTFAGFVGVHLVAQRKWAAATWKRRKARPAGSA